ncbi:MAG: mRNA-degrading endonuclease [Candidatus Tectomicrobia bacterium RIFCSPLOWO2_02_FULL_70_19]|nr:MAG: mRNA-degrading endonuclease [Candidatus Tectomicrobia bacterium RIFCSPLOWO2_02_FULL_70_19]
MVKRAKYIPDRGDIVWLRSNPQAGREQAGERPALVLSPKAYNERTSLAVLCPITGQRKGYPFEVTLPDGLPVGGVVLADQVKSLDWAIRLVSLKCKAPRAVLEEVTGKLSALIGS